MKKLITLVLALSLYGVNAQTSSNFSYQCSVRDNAGNLIENSAIGVEFTILKGGVSGTEVFQEVHNVNTSADGKLTLMIGDGSVINGTDLQAIDWGSDVYYLKMSMDVSGGTNYSEMSNTQLVSVPYALYAENTKFDGDSSSVNELQSISINNNEITLSNNGGVITLPDNFSGNYDSLSNTPQNLSDFYNDLAPGFSGQYDSLLNAPQNLSDFSNDLNFITSESDSSVVNELQTLTQVLALGNSAGQNRIINLANPIDSNDAVTKRYVDFLNLKLDSLSEVIDSLADNTNDGVTPILTAQQRLNRGESPFEIFTSDNSLLDSLNGCFYQGGLIFHLDTTDGTGLVASPVDINSISWSDVGTAVITSANGTTIGTGQQNTVSIISSYNSGVYAAQSANNFEHSGYNDWFLPSKDELNTFYTNYYQNNVTPSGTIHFWTSTEVDSLNAWVQSFSNSGTSSQFSALKVNSKNIKPIRIFGANTSNVPSIQERLTAGETPFDIYQSDNNLIDSLYGKFYQGGLIFSLNTTDGSGLIVSQNNVSDSIPWSDTPTGILTGASGEEVGKGLENTDSIIETYTAGNYAAKLCQNYFSNGYSDWYLPSKDELHALFVNYYQNNNAHIPTGHYWTSTEYDAYNAWVEAFVPGNPSNQYSSIKTEARKVKAVRHFNNSNSGSGIDGGVAGDMVFVEGGTYFMGCPSSSSDCESNESPAHLVTLSDFSIGKYEVTNAEFAHFLNSEGNQVEGGAYWLDINDYDCDIEIVNGSYQPEEGDANKPVVEVTWFGAKAYAAWVGGRLPTEAEWEYAAKGGSISPGYKYSGSNYLNLVGWHSGSDSYFNYLYNVGQKLPNELGIYDMSGNALEWCSDKYGGYYSGDVTNPTGPNNGFYKVLRGGSSYQHYNKSRVVHRQKASDDVSEEHIGFRIVIP